LKIYRELFEKGFLANTEQFYRKEVSTLLATGTTMDYMRKVSGTVFQRSVDQCNRFL
jgi:hypothetical protein